MTTPDPYGDWNITFSTPWPDPADILDPALTGRARIVIEGKREALGQLPDLIQAWIAEQKEST